MSGAIWIAAKNKSLPWRRLWPRWSKARAPRPARGVVVDNPLVLVGTYEQIEGLNRAVEEFAAAAFGAEDALFICAYAPPRAPWWIRMGEWVRERLANHDAETQHVPIDVEGAEELLASAGGFVLVRCSARFHQACEIIERTGGRVGLASGPPIETQYGAQSAA